MTSCVTTRKAHFRLVQGDTEFGQTDHFYASVKDLAGALELTVHRVRGMVYNGSLKQKRLLQANGVSLYRLSPTGKQIQII